MNRDRLMEKECVMMVAKWEGMGRMGEEVRGLRSTNRQLQNSHWDVKYSIGNGEAKELTYISCGHEQQWRALPEGEGKGGKTGATATA